MLGPIIAQLMGNTGIPALGFKPFLPSPTGGFLGTVSASADRTSSYNPLSILFRADATTYPGVTYPKHDLTYIWDFGDTLAGAHIYGALAGYSRNYHVGPWACHVYEKPGVYQPRVIVMAPDGEVSNWFNLPTVTVIDQATISSFDTFVVAPDGDFTGAPPGTQVNSASLTTVLTQGLAPCKLAVNARPVRILLKRGTTLIDDRRTQNAMSATALWNRGATSAIRIGAWGSATAKPIIQASANSVDPAFSPGNDAIAPAVTADICIHDVTWDGGLLPQSNTVNVSQSSLIGYDASYGGMANFVTIYNVTLKNSPATAFGVENQNLTATASRVAVEHWVMAHCDEVPRLPFAASGGPTYPAGMIYMGVASGAVYGCYINPGATLYAYNEANSVTPGGPVTSHGVRITQVQKMFVCAHNTIEGAYNTRHHSKIHATYVFTYAKVAGVDFNASGAVALDTVCIPTTHMHAGTAWEHNQLPPVFKCVQAGTVASYTRASDGATVRFEPLWNTSSVGAQTTDGTVIWQYVGTDLANVPETRVRMYTAPDGSKSMDSRNIHFAFNRMNCSDFNYASNMGQQDVWSREHVEDVIIDGNLWLVQPKPSCPSGKSGLKLLFLEASCNRVSVRNNRFEMSNMTSTRMAIDCAPAVVPFADWTVNSATAAGADKGKFVFKANGDDPRALLLAGYYRHPTTFAVLPGYTTASTTGYTYFPPTSFQVVQSGTVLGTFTVYNPTSAGDETSFPPCANSNGDVTVRVNEAISAAITSANPATLTITAFTPKPVTWGTVDNVWINNNTAVIHDADGGSVSATTSMISFGTQTGLRAAQNVLAKNNLFFAPGYSSGVISGSAAVLTAANNTTTATVDPLLDAKWKPGASSYAHAGGAVVPLRLDAYLKLRSSTTPSVGAVE